MINRHIVFAMAVTFCGSVALANENPFTPSDDGALFWVAENKSVLLSQAYLLAQASSDRPNAPYLSMQESVLREVAKISVDEGIKYGALTFIATQTYSPASSAVAVAAIKFEVIKDLSFAVVRGIANSDYIRSKILTDPLMRKQFEVVVKVFEGTMDLGMFLNDVSNIIGMSDADLTNLLSTLPSSITDAMDASEAYLTTVEGVRFMKNAALELQEECEFAAARNLLRKSENQIKNEVLPKLVRLLHEKIEIITGYHLKTIPEDLPIYWQQLPYLDRKFAEAMGGTYHSLAVAYHIAINLATALPELSREVETAEKQYIAERASVENMLMVAKNDFENCRTKEGQAALDEIRKKYFYKRILSTSPMVKSYGCWGWIEPKYNELISRYGPDSDFEVIQKYMESYFRAAMDALSRCQLDKALQTMQQYQGIGLQYKDKCADQKNAELNKIYAATVNSSRCPSAATATQKTQTVAAPSACAVAADSQAQKRALHARIGQYLKFRRDGGDQWHPDHTMRAGYSVGSENLKATAMELAAMAKLIDDYHAAYQSYWGYHEGELLSLMQAMQDAERVRDYALASRLRQDLGKKGAEASKARDEDIRRADEEFKMAMKRAREMCK